MRDGRLRRSTVVPSREREGGKKGERGKRAFRVLGSSVSARLLVRFTFNLPAENLKTFAIIEINEGFGSFQVPGRCCWQVSRN
jgi:hypothetical protein